MKAFFKRRLAVHIWFLAALVPYGLYLLGISSREAANAVSGITQALKDGYAWFWYLFPFSVVEWFYVAFAVGVLAVLAVLLRRLRSWRGGGWRALTAASWFWPVCSSPPGGSTAFCGG